jgi:DNA-binding response OmpR family regulator
MTRKKTAATADVEVLLVDDDPDSLDLMACQLQAAGLRVATASSGQEALEKIGAGLPGVIVADVKMPGMSGYELCRQVRSLGHKGIPFIFCSALNGSPERLSGLRAGADDYLPKLTAPEELVLRIRGHLSRKRRLETLERGPEGTALIAGLLGEVEVASVFQIVDLVDLESVVVRLDGGGVSGTAYVQARTLVHAEIGTLTGTKAFFRMLDWHEGRFSIEHGAWDGVHSVSQRLDRCVLEGLAHLDECRRLRQALGGNGDSYAVLSEPGGPGRQSLDEEGAHVLRLFEARGTLAGVLDATPLSDLKVLRIVCKLLTSGIVARRVAATTEAPEKRA